MKNDKITVKIFAPGNKRLAKRLTIRCPRLRCEVKGKAEIGAMPEGTVYYRRQVFTDSGVQSQLEDIAEQVERLAPGEEYRLVELSEREFSFVHVGRRATEVAA
jgi:hypothetical protein